MFGKYSFSNLVSEAYKNKEIVIAHLRGQNVEHFGSNMIVGMTLTTFIIVLILSFIPWFIALYLLVTRFQTLETWAIILAVLGLCTGLGSIVSIVAILLGKKNTKKASNSLKGKQPSSKKQKSKKSHPKSGKNKMSQRDAHIYKMIKGTWKK